MNTMILNGEELGRPGINSSISMMLCGASQREWMIENKLKINVKVMEKQEA